MKKSTSRVNATLVVMVKMPVCGGVKTRLARDIGTVGATRFYRTLLATTLPPLLHDARWRAVIAVSPDSSRGSPMWRHLRLCGASQQGQGVGDLGDRMARVFAINRPGPMVIIGSDIPEILRHHIAEAFQKLGRHDAVIGPSHDGGYWLIGLKRCPKILSIFAQIRWSSAHSLEDTLASLKGRKIYLMDELEDVDDGPAYVKLKSHASRLIPPV